MPGPPRTDPPVEPLVEQARPGGRARTRANRVAMVLGGLTLAAGVVATIARSVPGGVGADTFAMATAFTDFGLAGYVAAVVLFGIALATRFRMTTLVLLASSLVLGGVHASWIAPRFIAENDAAAGPRLTVLAENLLLGDADPAAVVASAASADVVVVVEATQASAEGMQRYGMERRFPHTAGGPLPARGAAGTRIYSRWPILESRPLTPRSADLAPTDGNYNWLAWIDVPELGPITVVAAHPTRPVPGSSRWWPEQQLLMSALSRERTVVAGDFNAVSSHPSLRQLQATGFRGADDILGAGWSPTFPANGRVPPVLTIDHILLSPDLSATAFRTLDIPGSDHRGVEATVALRG